MKALFTWSILFFSLVASAQENTALEKAMKKMKVQTVLIANVEGIDEYPLWSPESDFVACYTYGDWYKFDLKKMTLASGDWHDRKIGIMNNPKAVSAIKDSAELKRFMAVSPFNAREVVTKSGIRVQLKEGADFSVSLVVTKPGKDPQIIWTSGGENCHSLTLSPDQKFVAYLCELNGMMVMKIE